MSMKLVPYEPICSEGATKTGRMLIQTVEEFCFCLKKLNQCVVFPEGFPFHQFIITSQNLFNHQ